MTDLKKARDIVKKADTEKQRQCLKEINVILKKYGFALKATTPQIRFIKTR